ncbi:MAG: ribosome maturation factor RimM [Treponema brennaborense]|nr:ribosome maturation factor RimM [Treponema brennaborense]
MSVGIIRAAFGLAGDVKVESTSGEHEHFSRLTEVTLRKAGAETAAVVEAARTSGAFLLVKFAGIDTIEQAKALAGSEIVVPRDMACPLRTGEYYIEDLKGCSLVYYGENIDGPAAGTETAGTAAGIITDVVEGGAGYLLEVLPAESADSGKTARRTVMVPFKNEFIGTIDIDRKLVCLMHLWILE